jgi:hypothetical protein
MFSAQDQRVVPKGLDPTDSQEGGLAEPWVWVNKKRLAHRSPEPRHRYSQPKRQQQENENRSGHQSKRLMDRR